MHKISQILIFENFGARARKISTFEISKNRIFLVGGGSNMIFLNKSARAHARAPKIFLKEKKCCARAHVKYLGCAPPCARHITSWNWAIFQKLAIFAQALAPKASACAKKLTNFKFFFKNEKFCACAKCVPNITF